MKTGITKNKIKSIVKEHLGEKVTKIKKTKGGAVNDWKTHQTFAKMA